MLSYQQNFFDQTKELTAERFTQLTLSDAVVKTIAEVRRLLEDAHAAQVLIDANPDPTLLMNEGMEDDRKKLLNEAAKLKRSLPKIIWQSLSESQTVHSFVNVRSSGKGNYLSYCYNIDIVSKEHLERTYALLRTIPGLKFAL